MFAAADAGVQERGKAQPGDKTVIDALHPAAARPLLRPCGPGSRWRAAGAAALAAAETGRDSVTPAAQQDRPRRLGRRTHRGQGGPRLRGVRHHVAAVVERL